MKIILGVSGSIAAYKAAYLVRLWIKQGHEVQVLMTESAKAFISPLTLSTLSKRPVLSEVVSEESWNNHVELGLWADAMVVAPASANTLAKMANGLCDNILSAVFLSARCPVFVAPAMDLDMWKHAATKRNLTSLQEFGVQIIPVGHGELASGLVGDGRMAEPEEIVSFLQQKNQPKGTLMGKRALVTAGPTFEALDPVRFIGNHSTGKMGIAIAEALAGQGATVTLVLGPTELRPNHPAITVVPVVSAAEMHQACEQVFHQADIAVMAAAVADYKPRQVSETKIKKKDNELTLELEKTVDIAATLGKSKRTEQIFVGFALETDNEKNHALIKLAKKNFDFIVLNSMRIQGAGFGHDTNQVTILRKDGTQSNFALKSKKSVAEDIVHEICSIANQNSL